MRRPRANHELVVTSQSPIHHRCQKAPRVPAVQTPSTTQSLPNDILRQCLFLAGPTACGKTDISLQLAEQLGNVEVLSLDSMCLYRGMTIGTAKPTDADQQRVPHHLIDLIDPHEDFSVAQFLAAAIVACEQIVARGNRPLFVGGTGLYLRSVLRGVFEGPAADWTIRNRLELQAAESAARGDHYWLMRQLEKVDPESALKLHPNDQRRLIRAIEVFELTGKPLSAQQLQPPLPVEQRPPHVYWLDVPRDWLHERIDRRVVAMCAAGLVDEVRGLLALPKGVGQTARQGLGYKELMDALSDNATAELSDAKQAECVELIQTRTRQFAKRQCTWFRNMDECVVIPLTGSESPTEAAGVLAARIS